MYEMSNAYRILLIALGMQLSFLVYQPVFAQSVDELRLDKLDVACLKAREAKLSVVQRQKIEECVNEPETRSDKKSRKECEAYWKDYGWTIGGLRWARPYLFADVPECIRAFEARQQYWAMSQGMLND
jgi:hypothetical protein